MAAAVPMLERVSFFLNLGNEQELLGKEVGEA